LVSIFSIAKNNDAQSSSVTIEVGQVWHMPDAFVDRYCEPIITRIVEIKDNIVIHINNYGVKTEENISMFKALYTLSRGD
jgi:hypothetical protein